ncbi:MAG: hypothetical protein QNK40_15935 [Desulfobacterales bacterium]|nr:hypothetical protein [Desulfobacterales bacterium]
MTIKIHRLLIKSPYHIDRITATMIPGHFRGESFPAALTGADEISFDFNEKYDITHPVV